ncbi:MAG: hypothetical protein COX79_00905 [Candidatus Levybacteria bacterium CG_4_10_14_0_2_um_filter_36_16]|nr:MAG: hypothetical protein COU26_02990 [Candidatus Levybacteria bacterium CG10_big_fil_rev_8_21_14_0_10_36_30]PIZ97774.1 MAG: hypothetical protein COX79_00905 [Candidatus Levybacteria bacterium CG_4_10_14_0_2_um_filter_36_16]
MNKLLSNKINKITTKKPPFSGFGDSTVVDSNLDYHLKRSISQNKSFTQQKTRLLSGFLDDSHASAVAISLRDVFITQEGQIVNSMFNNRGDEGSRTPANRFRRLITAPAHPHVFQFSIKV